MWSPVFQGIMSMFTCIVHWLKWHGDVTYRLLQCSSSLTTHCQALYVKKNLLLDWNHQPPLIQQIWLVVTFWLFPKLKVHLGRMNTSGHGKCSYKCDNNADLQRRCSVFLTMEALLGLVCSCSVRPPWKWPLLLCCTGIFATQPFWKLNSYTSCTVTDKKYIVIYLMTNTRELHRSTRHKRRAGYFFSKHAGCWHLSQQQNWAIRHTSNLPHRPFPSTDTLILGHNLLTYLLFTYSVSSSDYVRWNE
jgi:hypothetical protein